MTDETQPTVAATLTPAPTTSFGPSPFATTTTLSPAVEGSTKPKSGSYGNVNGKFPSPVTFGPNTINFGSGLFDGDGVLIADPTPAAVPDPKVGLPIRLNTNQPGGTLPTGLLVGTIYWITGTGPDYGLAKSKDGLPASFTGGSGSNTAVLVSTAARAAPAGTDVAEAITLLNDARERLAVNAVSDVGYFIGRAITLLGG
jgi:hypothetical protein